MQKYFEKIKERVCEFIHERNKSGYAPCKNQRASCLQLIRVCDLTAIINQVAEEFATDTNVGNKDGWIPVSSGKLPEEKENPVTRDWYVYPVMVKFEEITDIRYYSFGNGHWHHGPGIMDKYVTHWMDIKPYQPKGE